MVIRGKEHLERLTLMIQQKSQILRSKVNNFWRTLFPRTIREFEQVYCSLCDGRIWWWQRTTRLYSLGLTRVHLVCGVQYLHDEIKAHGLPYLDSIERLRRG